MGDELRNAFNAFIEALDKELRVKDDKIDNLRNHATYLECENNKLKTNLKNTASILAAAADALQEGLNGY